MQARTARAKQFLPFDALKGLQEALRVKEKELEFEERKELSEEILNNLDVILNRIEIGNTVRVRYYRNKRYNEIKGMVNKINFIKKNIQLNNGTTINIADIVDIEII